MEVVDVVDMKLANERKRRITLSHDEGSKEIEIATGFGESLTESLKTRKLNEDVFQKEKMKTET